MTAETRLVGRHAVLRCTQTTHAISPASGLEWQLRLYVAGQTVRSLRAIDNLRRICATKLPGSCRIEIIDLSRNPELARADDILVLPTMVRRTPQPVMRIIGDLSDAEHVLDTLRVGVVPAAVS